MLRLLIAGKEVDLSEGTQVSLTYQASDTENPTAEKNTFSKTIDLYGTPRNNDIFGEIWRLDRINYDDMFDARKRVDAVIYDNNDFVEKGYVQLSQIEVNGNEIIYHITFFGGIGSFFYSLMYNEEGDELTLADLFYGLSYLEGGFYNKYTKTSEPLVNDDGSFKTDEKGNILYSKGEDDALLCSWDRNFIKSSWDALRNSYKRNSIEEYLTACPAYSGLYDDYENDKVLVNLYNTTTPFANDAVNKYTPSIIWVDSNGKEYDSVPPQGVNATAYTHNNFWSVLTAPRDLTEWEVGGLNSSMQRPAVKLSWILDAISNPINNGGFNVVWDKAFSNENSPLFKYYNNSYIVFNRFDFEASEGVYESGLKLKATPKITSGLIQYSERIVDEEGTSNVIDATKYSNPSVEVNIQPQINVKKNDFVNGRWADELKNIFVQKKTWYGTFLAYRLKITDNNTNSISYSPIYAPYSTTNEGTFEEIMWKILIAEEFGYYDTGAWTKVILFEKQLKASSTSIINRVDYVTYAFDGTFPIVMNLPYSNNVTIEVETKVIPMVMAKYGNYKKTSSMSYLYETSSRNIVEVNDIRLALNDEGRNIYFDGNVSPSLQNTYINKQVLFGRSETPFDYLISFTKLLGLKYIYDSSNNSVNIVTRETYFMNEVVDLEKKIDRGRTMLIKPYLTDYKWMKWGLESEETYADYLYSLKNKNDYGHLLYDTSYYFNKEVKKIFDGVIYNSVIPYKMASAYHNKLKEGNWNIPSIVQSKTFNYTLWKRDGDRDAFETTRYGKGATMLLPRTKDMTDKICCFDRSNANVGDISNALVLFGGFADDKVVLYDNMQVMYDLVDNPCHVYFPTQYRYEVQSDIYDISIMYGIDNAIQDTTLVPTTIKPLALTTYYPKFTKYLPNENGTYEITYDFVKPNETFIEDGDKYRDSAPLYNLWKDYIKDMYDKDGKMVTAYAIIQENPNDALRKFYYFDNCIWLLNKINDYKPRTELPLECEFIKITSIDNIRGNGVFNELFEETESKPVIPDWEDEDEPITPPEEPTVQPNDEIWYTTTDGLIIDKSYIGGVQVLSNTYEAGKGIFKLNREINQLGYGEFFNKKTLKSIIIPNSVTTIGVFVFEGCSSLTSVTIPNSVTSIGNSAFQDCTSLTRINSDVDGVFNIPNSVTSIGNNTFIRCTSLTSVTIPNSVTSIASNTFSDCESLTSVTIPNSVTSIDVFAFYNVPTTGDLYCSRLWYNNLTQEQITNLGNVYNWRKHFFEDEEGGGNDPIIPPTDPTNPDNPPSGGDDDNPTNPVIYPSNDEIWYTTTDGLTAQTTDTTGIKSLNEMGLVSNTYENGKGVMKFSKDVTNIGTYAFGYCESITSVTIPSSVTSIDGGAFIGCTYLTRLNSDVDGVFNVPENVTSIGGGVFSYCASLLSIDIPSSVTIIDDYMFQGCTSLTSVTIPDSVTKIGKYAFYYCGLISIDIPNSVTSIGELAFNHCYDLTSVIIGNSVTSIGQKAFEECIILTSVTIPSSVTSIASSAFNLVPTTGDLYCNEDWYTKYQRSLGNLQNWTKHFI